MKDDPQTLYTFVGGLAPDFEVMCVSSPTKKSRKVSLSHYRGKWLVLVFYPQDFSLICPSELTALSESYEEFTKLNVRILAISTDSIKSHARWLGAEKSEGGIGPIKFPLGSDEDHSVSKKYRVLSNTHRLSLRGIFIIDPNAVVQYQLVQNLNTGRRVNEIIRVLKALQTGGLCSENWSDGKSVIKCASILRPGMVISNYLIKEIVGTGGFSTVFKAFDRNLDRIVALKILKVKSNEQLSVKNEAKLNAALSHPNICTIYHTDDSEGFSIVVMEFLHGKTLNKIIESETKCTLTVENIICQIANGMSFAHSKGIVHGDLKPSNIIVTDDGIAKIVDFGLSKRIRKQEDFDYSKTVSMLDKNIVSGTPNYMSPEQANGDGTSIASDIFSLGLIIIELLTKKKVFSGNNTLNIFRQVSQIEPKNVTQEIPDRFQTLVQQMLQPEPGKRLASMEGVIDKLK